MSFNFLKIHYNVIFSNAAMRRCQDEISMNNCSTTKTWKITIIGQKF